MILSSRKGSVTFSAADEARLRAWRGKSDRSIPSPLMNDLANRARAVLLLAGAHSDRRLSAVAAKVQLSAATVMRLRDRVIARGVEALAEGLSHARRIDRRVRANLKIERAEAIARGRRDGSTTRELAAKFHVSQATAGRWIREGAHPKR